MRFPWTRKKPVTKPVDVAAFLASLDRAELGEGYDMFQRHRDFKKVLTETPEGRRVLYQILQWTYFIDPCPQMVDANMVLVHNAKRHVGVSIYTAVNVDPYTLGEVPYNPPTEQGEVI